MDLDLLGTLDLPDNPPARSGSSPQAAGALISAEDLTRFAPPQDAATREGAVLMLFGHGPAGPDLLLTERAHDMRSHPGQVSFPGRLRGPG